MVVKMMIYSICFGSVQKHMRSGNILVIGGKTSLTFFLQTFLMILKNVYFLDSLVIVMIY